MVRHILSTELPNDCVVPALIGTALRHEVALLQQLGPIFLQEPLDRAGASFVWSDVDIADAFCHSRIITRRVNPGPVLPTVRPFESDYFCSLRFLLSDIIVHLFLENIERQRAIFEYSFVKFALIEFFSQLFLCARAQFLDL